ncbi:MAG: hypothetical protein MK329_01845 [Pirellulales bacterium]|nr:hypothetical protein [Pirellulales bacterium]
MTDDSKQNPFERVIPPDTRWNRILIMVLCLTGIGCGVVEAIARSRGYEPTYPRIDDMWISRWLELDQSPDDRTVFLGTSRTKFGLRLDEWEKVTGRRPLMLAWPGSHAQPVLHELAEHESYKGTVILGVAPPYLFNNKEIPWAKWIYKILDKKDIAHISLSYHLSKWGRDFLLTNFRFVNPAGFSPVELCRLSFPIPDREGMLLPFLPPYLFSQTHELQSQFIDGATEDVEAINDLTSRLKGDDQWFTHFGSMDMPEFLMKIRQDVEKIEAKGGRVIFVRHPSDSYYYDMTVKHFPRKDFYDQMIKATGCLGIHFEDYPELMGYELPDGSHLKPEDANEYTRKIIDIIARHDNGEL